jgi:hypothetical protein
VTNLDRILAAFREAKDGLTRREVVGFTDVAKPTVYRWTQRMILHGALTQKSPGRWVLVDEQLARTLLAPAPREWQPAKSSSRPAHRRRGDSFRGYIRLLDRQYLYWLDRQAGVCAICEQPPGDRRFCVDHCHATGQIRGLLCDRCNTGIGLLGDSPERLANARDYVAAFECPAAPKTRPRTRRDETTLPLALIDGGST